MLICTSSPWSIFRKTICNINFRHRMVWRGKGEDEATGHLVNKVWLSSHWVLKCYLMLFLHSPSLTGWIYVSESLKTILLSISVKIPEKITRNNSGKQRSVNFIHLIINKIDLWNHGPIYLISLYVLFSQRRTQGNLVNYANLCMVKGRNFQERVL